MKYFVHHESSCKWAQPDDAPWPTGDDGNVLEVDKEFWDQMDYDDGTQAASYQQDLLVRQSIEENNNERGNEKMAFTARQQGREFKALAPGVYAGVCTLLVDIGLQPGGRYKDALKVVLGFELPDAPARDDGKPTMIYRNVTNSMDKKANLRKIIEGWFGRQFPTDEAARTFDLSKLLGQAGLVNVSNDERNGKVYANISGITPLMAGMAKPVAKGEKVFYTETDPGTAGALADVPAWIKNLIDQQLREEQPVTATAAAGSAIADDDIPF